MDLLRRLIPAFIVLTLLLPIPAFSRNPAQAPLSTEPPAVQIVQAGEEGLRLSLDTSASVPGAAGRTEVATLFSAFHLTANPGEPQMPVVRALVAVPPEAVVSLEILPGVTEALPGSFRLPAAPVPAPLDGDLQPGRFQDSPDPQIYSQDGSYPGEAARITEDAWIRDQRVLRIEFYPFQYLPRQGSLVWRPAIDLRVHFERGAPGDYRCFGDCEQPGLLEPLLENTLLNYEQARAWRGRPAAEAGSALEAPQQNGGETRHKIVVDQDGLYRLTYADLQAAGLDVDNIDPRNLYLTNQGRDVAIHVEGQGDGIFHPTDSVLFFGEQFRGDYLAALYAAEMDDWLWLCPACELAGMFEKYTDENVYWLGVGASPGLRMSQVSGDPGGSLAPVPTFYNATVRAEQFNKWFTHHFSSEDTWFWEEINVFNQHITRTYTTTLSALAPQSLNATVRAEVVSRNINNNHQTEFYINNLSAPIDTATWNGKTNYAFEVSVAQANLLEGENELHFVMLPNGSERMYFNYFEIDYGRQFAAMADELLFNHEDPGPWKYQVTGVQSSSAVILDLADALNPVLITGATVAAGGGGNTVTFVADPPAGGRFIVAGAAAERSPKAITEHTPTDYSATAGVDYVLITHPDFTASVQTLAAYRAGKGLSTLVVDVEELYDQFNFGIYHPVAIRNFLAYTFSNWSVVPRYALLVGGGHWNFKGYPGAFSPPIYMPPNLAFVDPWQGEVDSANLLATLVGDDFMPDLSIGRMPADSQADLDVMISKVMAYESAPVQDWQKHILFVNDNTPDPAGDFVALAAGLINDYLAGSPYFLTDTINLDSYCGPPTSPPTPCPAVNSEIVSAINNPGALLVNYNGHASVNNWSHESVFVNADISALNNADRLPVVLSMTCLDGYWIHPGQTGNTQIQTSLVEDLLRTDGRGAVATFSATGLGVATGHDDLQRGFYDALINDGIWDMGGASLAAKWSLLVNGSGFNRDLMHTFMVFGDPALHVLNPYGAGVTPSAEVKNALPQSTVQFNLEVENTGLLTDSYTTTLSSSAWPSQVNTTIVGPLAPGQSADVTVTVDVPIGATGLDVTEFNAISHGDQGKVAVAFLTTIVDAWEILLPVVRK